MLPPQASRLPVHRSTKLASYSARGAVALPYAECSYMSISHLHQQRRDFWRATRVWDSHLDPEYLEYQRRRSRRVRGALKDALRRQNRWQLPVSWTRCFGARHASHWSKDIRGWYRENGQQKKKQDKYNTEQDYELSHAEKRRRKHYEDMKTFAESNPYEAVFGRPFEPFWSRLWGSSEAQQENTHDARLDSTNSEKKVVVEQLDGTIKSIPVKSSAQNQKRHKSSASFGSSERNTSTKLPGKGEASSTSKQFTTPERTNDVYTYDPVSGRMVELDRSPVGSVIAHASNGAATTISMKNNVSPISTGKLTAAKLSSLPKDDLDFLTADHVRASMGKIRNIHSTESPGAKSARREQLERKFESKSTSTVNDVEETRRVLAERKDRLMSKDTASSHVERLQPAVERMIVSPRSKDAKPEVIMPERIREALALLDDYPNEPIGLQTSYEKEKASNVGHTETALERDIADKHLSDIEFDDGYSKEPTGMEISFTEERTASEDGSQKEKLSLADEIKARDQEAQNARSGLSGQYQDGFSERPVGMETSYASEREHSAVDGTKTLEEELKAMSQETSSSTVDPALEQALSSGTRIVKSSTGPTLTLEEELNAMNQERQMQRESIASALKVLSADARSDSRSSTNQTDATSLEEEMAAMNRQRHDSSDSPPSQLEQALAECTRRQESERHVSKISSLEEELKAMNKSSQQGDSALEKALASLESLDASPKSRGSSLEEELKAMSESHQEEDPSVAKLEQALSAADQRQGLVHQPFKGPSLEEEMKAMNGPSVIEDPATSALEKALSPATQRQRSLEPNPHAASLEDEMKAMNRPSKAYQDHRSQPPRGLQFLFGGDPTTEPQMKHTPKVEDKRKVAAAGLLRNEVESQKSAMKLQEGRLGQATKTPGSSKPFTTTTKLPASPVSSMPIGGEGDICVNVVKYADRDRWYKQDKSFRDLTKSHESASSLRADIEKICIDHGLFTDNKLVFEARGAPPSDKKSDRIPAQDVKELERVGRRLEQTLGRNVTKARRAVEKHFHAQEKKLEARLHHLDHRLQALGRRTAKLQTAEKSNRGPTTSPEKNRWAEPASYKILSYDPRSDSVQTVTVTSRFSENESPMSVPQVLAELRTVASTFMPYFASLQEEGYQAVRADKDEIVLRKVAELASPKTQKVDSSKKTVGPVNINPVDGTSRPVLETATGNFASPTGFVNHDPIFPPEKPTVSITGNADDASPLSSPIKDGVYYRHYPRVRRQEAVFSGLLNARHGHGKQKVHQRKRTWRRRIRFALSVGATSAALVYALGVGAELSKGEKKKIVLPQGGQ